MEFTPELLGFQGVLISADNVHSFSKLTARGGNDEKIKYVVECIYKHLEKEKYIANGTLVEGKESEMRKFTLFLILNSELPVLEEMVVLDGIHSVMWTIPTIPRCLLNDMVWSAHMDIFLAEVMVFSYPQLALEIATSVLEHLKYCSPPTSLPRLKIVSAACYRLLCRLHFYNFENRHFSNIISSIFNIFQKCLNYFVNPPNISKLVTKDEQYLHKGYSLWTMLDVMDGCLNQFTAKPEFEPTDFDDIYMLTFKEGLLLNESSKKPARSQDILEHLDKCNTILLEKCQELVMGVSVDIFCSWSEFEENGKSLQQTIGETCYKLRNKLLTLNSMSEHPVVNMFQELECKPETFEEVISQADIETIGEYLIKTENKEELISALLHKENLCYDLDLIDIVVTYIDILKEKDYLSLYEICENHCKNNVINSEVVESLALKAFQYCSTKDKSDILEKHFNGKIFSDKNELPDFHNVLTEIFNKLISAPDADLSDILNVFIQSPQKVFTKIFHLAADSNRQAVIMLKAMKLLEKYSDHYYQNDTEPCIIKIAHNIFENYLDMENKQNNFVKFVSDLKQNKVLSGGKLLLRIIMPNLHKALTTDGICAVNIQVKLLREAYILEELKQYRAPMLAMFAQILEKVRWKIDTFSPLSPNVVALVLQLQTELFDTYDGGIPGNEETWLRNRLKNLQPLNAYYYRKLWAQSDGFLEAVTGMMINTDLDQAQLAAWLSLILCSCTQKEWCEIWDSLSVLDESKVLDILCGVLTTITRTESNHRTEITWSCLLNSYRNFIYIIRYKFFRETLTDSQVFLVLNKIATLTRAVGEEKIEDLEPTLMPLFSYLVERRKDYNLNVAHSLTDLLKKSKLLEVSNKVFCNGTE